MRYFYSLLLVLFLTHATAQIPAPPELSKYKTQKLKLEAWVMYCEQLYEGQNTALLKKNALKGFSLISKDDFEHHSLFNFYLGSSFDYLTEVDSAVYYLEKSQAYLKRSTHKENTPRLLKELLYAYKNVGLVNKRKKIILEYEKIIELTNQENQKFLLQEDLADYYLSLGQYETSLKYYLNGIQTRKRALNSRSVKKDSIAIGVKLVNITDVYLNIEKTDEAFESIKEAENYIADYKTGMAFVYKYFIAIYVNKDNFPEIEKYYNKLSELIRSGAENKAWDAYLASDLTIADYLITKKKQYESALKYIEHARSSAPKYASAYMLGSIDYMSGEVYFALKQYDKALFYLKKAEPIAKEDDPQAYSWLKNALAKTYAAQGKWQLAYENLSSYSAIKDTLLAEMSKKNIAKMEAQYQNKKKQGEINMLSAKNKINNLEIENANRQRILFIIGLVLLFIVVGSLVIIYRNKHKSGRILEQKNHEMNLLNEKLEKANTTKAKLFSIIGHDLRSPISHIYQFLDLQKSEPELFSEADKARHNERITHAASTVLETMEDLLIWSKSQMQQFTVSAEKIPVLATIESIIGLMQTQIDTKKINVDMPIGASEMLYSDRNIFTIIIRNLLQNAVKYSPENSTINISAHRTNNTIQITIADQGSGMPEAVKAIFKTDSATVDSGHSGLGLTLVKEMAELLHARVDIADNPSGGTSVIISIDKPSE